MKDDARARAVRGVFAAPNVNMKARAVHVAAAAPMLDVSIVIAHADIYTWPKLQCAVLGLSKSCARTCTNSFPAGLFPRGLG
jgi:hypothetical protein